MVRTLAGATRQTVELDTVQIHPISRMALLHTQMATRTYAETTPPGLESMEPPQRMQTQIGKASGIPGHSNVAPLHHPALVCWRFTGATWRSPPLQTPAPRSLKETNLIQAKLAGQCDSSQTTIPMNPTEG